MIFAADLKAFELDFFQILKCVSYLLMAVTTYGEQGIQLSGGITRSIAEDGTKFLGKFLEESLRVTNRDESILLFFYLFFFPAILLFFAYYAPCFAQELYIRSALIFVNQPFPSAIHNFTLK